MTSLENLKFNNFCLKRQRKSIKIPEVSAKAWCLLDGNNGEMIWGKCEHERREIASLTKIMTALTAINIIKKYDISVMGSKIEVNNEAALQGGTTAYLSEEDLLSLWDLMHGMLIPSGNDAAYSIAYYFGELIVESFGYYKSFSKRKDPASIFVDKMNKNAANYSLKNTTFANPTGLSNYFNKSTAYDYAKLSMIAMNEPMIREIVNKKSYKCKGLDLFGDEKEFKWINTNKLLDYKNFNGLKTGNTPSAGPCMSATYQDPSVNLICVSLGCKSSEDRWLDSLILSDFGSAMNLKSKNLE